jgi:hypothetical protein
MIAKIFDSTKTFAADITAERKNGYFFVSLHLQRNDAD